MRAYVLTFADRCYIMLFFLAFLIRSTSRLCVLCVPRFRLFLVQQRSACKAYKMIQRSLFMLYSKYMNLEYTVIFCFELSL